MRKTKLYCPEFCPPAGHTSQLWCHYCTYSKRFWSILLADPHKFPCRQKSSDRKFRTALLRLPRPLRKRLTALLYIYLGSALNSEAPHLFGSFFLSQAPTLPRQPFPGIHLRVSSTPQHIPPLHTNTIQNTSLPTKCPHRADLQHNDFLVPVIEALKGVYEPQPDVLRRGSCVEKPFPCLGMCSIPSNPGPEGEAHMGWGKGKLLFTLEMEVCWWDNMMEDVGWF